jgi:hypothetical protein
MMYKTDKSKGKIKTPKAVPAKGKINVTKPIKPKAK